MHLASLNLDPHRPLLICDADEVLLKFVQALEKWLVDSGYHVDFKTFSLTESVRNPATGNAVSHDEMEQLIDAFFDQKAGSLEPVPGAVESLEKLSGIARIIILSNVPATARAERQDAMAELGMNYPVIANQGAKGPVVAALAADHHAPVIFVDDLPPHHQSVALSAPKVHRLHFVADPRLASLIPKASHAHSRIDCWYQAHDWIVDRINSGQTGA